ncbi:unnamed protein product [Calypogeia fissa]
MSQGSMDEEASPAEHVPDRDLIQEALNCLLGAIAKEIASRASPAGAASAPSQDVSDLRENILRCQLDASSRGKTTAPTEEAEDEEEANRLSKLFFGRVRYWDTYMFMCMIEKYPQLMLKPFTWKGEGFVYNGFVAVCTVFQLAVLTNSSALVGKMVQIAIDNFGPKPQKLFDVFTVNEVETTVMDVADIFGNESIKAQLHSLGEDDSGQPSLGEDDSGQSLGHVVSRHGVSSAMNMLHGPGDDDSGQSLLDEVSSVMDMEVDFCGTKTQLRQLWHGLMPNFLEYMAIWGGRKYGITLCANEYDIFILHWMGYYFDETIWFQLFNRQDLFKFFKGANWKEVLKEVLKVVCRALSEKGLLDRLLCVRDDNGWTPLHYCRRPADFINVVREYFPLGNLFGVTDYQRRTPLHVAAALDDCVVIKRMATIAVFGEPSAWDANGFTPLHLAVIHNHFDVVKILLNSEFNATQGFRAKSTFFSNHSFVMTQPDGEKFKIQGLTPYHMAAMGGRESILRAFLEDKRLCDWGLYNPDKRSMILHKRRDRHRVLRGLPPSSALLYAAARRHPLAMKAISESEEMDRRQRFLDLLRGLPPALHLAAASGNPLVVKAILESGEIDPHAKDEDGNTALHYAAGWEVNLLDSNAFVSLHVFIEAKRRNPKLDDLTPQEKSLGGTIGCIDLLIQAGLDMEQPNDSGEPPRPGLSAPNELTTWWFDKLAKQSQEAKTNLAAAANAISVTAALVATASYVGPLQPPLGLSTSAEAWLTGYSQVNHILQFKFSCFVIVYRSTLPLLPSCCLSFPP